MNRSKTILLATIPVFASIGCKGKLPAWATSSPSTTLPAPTTPTTLVTGYTIGRPAPPFEGEILFGQNPRRAGKPDDIYIVTKALGKGEVPRFFYHFKLFPQVRWVQLTPKDNSKGALERTKELQKAGEVTDGLTIIGYDRKIPIPWRMGPMGDLTLIQNGVVVAQCWERDLDDTVSKILTKKFDTRGQANEFVRLVAEAKWAEKQWITLRDDFEKNKISFDQFAKRVVLDLDSINSPGQRAYFVSNFLTKSQCRPLSAVKPVLDRLGRKDKAAAIIRNDIDRHTSHPECRLRVLSELKLAMKDPNLDSEFETCRSLAQMAIQLDEKKSARQLLKKMIESKALEPRYARLLKDQYHQEYDDLMFRASH